MCYEATTREDHAFDMGDDLCLNLASCMQARRKAHLSSDWAAAQGVTWSSRGFWVSMTSDLSSRRVIAPKWEWFHPSPAQGCLAVQPGCGCHGPLCWPITQIVAS